MPRLDRRRFIMSSLLASGALAAASRCRAFAQARGRVIVVGAGVSGLAAARQLRDAGMEVIVLEGRERIGGRLFTDFSMGPPFEVGAGWIHGPSDDNPALTLAEAAGAELYVTDDANLTVFDPGGEEIPENALEEINDEWADLVGRIDSRIEANDRRSLATVANALEPGALDEPGMNWAFSAYTEFSKGGPLEDLSATLFDDDKVFPGADAIVLNGYDRLLGPISEGLDIRLATPVSAVAYSEDGVTISTPRGEIEADYLVCSVPLGVLKAGRIAFDPPLPARMRSGIEGIGFGSVTKIALMFDTPFWDIETQYFGIMTEPKGRWNYWLNYRTFAPQNILLGLSVGAYAPVADAMDDAAMTADALDVLRGVWGDAVGAPVQVLATHWSTDPFALGAYAYPRPGNTVGAYDALTAPVADRVFLCGEHTTFDYAGTIHGAWMSGLRVAEQVIDEAG